jgi:hypothetical protein
MGDVWALFLPPRLRRTIVKGTDCPERDSDGVAGAGILSGEAAV